MALIFPGSDRWGRDCYSFLALCGFALFAGAAAASEPLYVKNLSPVTGLFGLPSQRAATSQAVGTAGMALHASVANQYVAEFSNVEGLRLDGEVLRFALDLRYGFKESWDLQLEVPWLEHSGGDLDKVIDSWHSLWGMSDGGRPDVSRDLLDYRYRGPQASFALLEDASGVGDITVALNRVVYRSANSVATAALGYKFGTGNEDDFLGSGADDAYLALRFSGAHLAGLPLSWHTQLGYLRAGQTDILDSAQERDLWFAGLSLGWAFTPTLSLLIQVDANAAPVKSELTALGDDAIAMSLGARWRPARRWALEFNLVEDARVETAPDITFQASLRYTTGSPSAGHD